MVCRQVVEVIASVLLGTIDAERGGMLGDDPSWGHASLQQATSMAEVHGLQSIVG